MTLKEYTFLLLKRLKENKKKLEDISIDDTRNKDLDKFIPLSKKIHDDGLSLDKVVDFVLGDTTNVDVEKMFRDACKEEAKEQLEKTINRSRIRAFNNIIDQKINKNKKNDERMRSISKVEEIDYKLLSKNKEYKEIFEKNRKEYLLGFIKAAFKMDLDEKFFINYFENLVTDEKEKELNGEPEKKFDANFTGLERENLYEDDAKKFESIAVTEEDKEALKFFSEVMLSTARADVISFQSSVAEPYGKNSGQIARDIAITELEKNDKLKGLIQKDQGKTTVEYTEKGKDKEALKEGLKELNSQKIEFSDNTKKIMVEIAKSLLDMKYYSSDEKGKNLFNIDTFKPEEGDPKVYGLRPFLDIHEKSVELVKNGVKANSMEEIKKMVSYYKETYAKYNHLLDLAKKFDGPATGDNVNSSRVPSVPSDFIADFNNISKINTIWQCLPLIVKSGKTPEEFFDDPTKIYNDLFKEASDFKLFDYLKERGNTLNILNAIKTENIKEVYEKIVINTQSFRNIGVIPYFDKHNLDKNVAIGTFQQQAIGNAFSDTLYMVGMPFQSSYKDKEFMKNLLVYQGKDETLVSLSTTETLYKPITAEKVEPFDRKKYLESGSFDVDEFIGVIIDNRNTLNSDKKFDSFKGNLNISTQELAHEIIEYVPNLTEEQFLYLEDINLYGSEMNIDIVKTSIDIWDNHKKNFDKSVADILLICKNLNDELKNNEELKEKEKNNITKNINEIKDELGRYFSEEKINGFINSKVNLSDLYYEVHKGNKELGNLLEEINKEKNQLSDQFASMEKSKDANLKLSDLVSVKEKYNTLNNTLESAIKTVLKSIDTPEKARSLLRGSSIESFKNKAEDYIKSDERSMYNTLIYKINSKYFKNNDKEVLPQIPDNESVTENQIEDIQNLYPEFKEEYNKLRTSKMVSRFSNYGKENPTKLFDSLKGFITPSLTNELLVQINEDRNKKILENRTNKFANETKDFENLIKNEQDKENLDYFNDVLSTASDEYVKANSEKANLYGDKSDKMYKKMAVDIFEKDELLKGFVKDDDGSTFTQTEKALTEDLTSSIYYINSSKMEFSDKAKDSMIEIAEILDSIELYGSTKEKPKKFFNLDTYLQEEGDPKAYGFRALVYANKNAEEIVKNPNEKSLEEIDKFVKYHKDLSNKYDRMMELAKNFDTQFIGGNVDASRNPSLKGKYIENYQLVSKINAIWHCLPLIKKSGMSVKEFFDNPTKGYNEANKKFDNFEIDSLDKEINNKTAIESMELFNSPKFVSQYKKAGAQASEIRSISVICGFDSKNFERNMKIAKFHSEFVASKIENSIYIMGLGLANSKNQKDILKNLLLCQDDKISIAKIYPGNIFNEKPISRDKFEKFNRKEFIKSDNFNFGDFVYTLKRNYDALKGTKKINENKELLDSISKEIFLELKEAKVDILGTVEFDDFMKTTGIDEKYIAIDSKLMQYDSYIDISTNMYEEYSQSNAKETLIPELLMTYKELNKDYQSIGVINRNFSEYGKSEKNALDTIKTELLKTYTDEEITNYLNGNTKLSDMREEYELKNKVVKVPKEKEVLIENNGIKDEIEFGPIFKDTSLDDDAIIKFTESIEEKAKLAKKTIQKVEDDKSKDRDVDLYNKSVYDQRRYKLISAKIGEMVISRIETIDDAKKVLRDSAILNGDNIDDINKEIEEKEISAYNSSIAYINDKYKPNPKYSSIKDYKDISPDIYQKYPMEKDTFDNEKKKAITGIITKNIKSKPTKIYQYAGSIIDKEFIEEFKNNFKDIDNFDLSLDNRTISDEDLEKVNNLESLIKTNEDKEALDYFKKEIVSKVDREIIGFYTNFAESSAEMEMGKAKYIAYETIKEDKDLAKTVNPDGLRTLMAKNDKITKKEEQIARKKVAESEFEISKETKDILLEMSEIIESMELYSPEAGEKNPLFDINKYQREEGDPKVYGFKAYTELNNYVEEYLKENQNKDNLDEIKKVVEYHKNITSKYDKLIELAKKLDTPYFCSNISCSRVDAVPNKYVKDFENVAKINGIWHMFSEMKYNNISPKEYFDEPVKYFKKTVDFHLEGKAFDSILENDNPIKILQNLGNTLYMSRVSSLGSYKLGSTRTIGSLAYLDKKNFEKNNAISYSVYPLIDVSIIDSNTKLYNQISASKDSKDFLINLLTCQDEKKSFSNLIPNLHFKNVITGEEVKEFDYKEYIKSDKFSLEKFTETILEAYENVNLKDTKQKENLDLATKEILKEISLNKDMSYGNHTFDTMLEKFGISENEMMFGELNESGKKSLISSNLSNFKEAKNKETELPSMLISYNSLSKLYDSRSRFSKIFNPFAWGEKRTLNKIETELKSLKLTDNDLKDYKDGKVNTTDIKNKYIALVEEDKFMNNMEDPEIDDEPIIQEELVEEKEVKKVKIEIKECNDIKKIIGPENKKEPQKDAKDVKKEIAGEEIKDPKKENKKQAPKA